MKSIDQYYSLAAKELEEIAAMAAAAAKAMRNTEAKHPMDRALPCGMSDLHVKLGTVERMLTRYTMLLELNIGDANTREPVCANAIDHGAIVSNRS
jgi:hypothetical protein